MLEAHCILTLYHLYMKLVDIMNFDMNIGNNERENGATNTKQAVPLM